MLRKRRIRSVDKPPRWIGETGDTDWCFHEGQALEFVAQFHDPDRGEVYVFRGITDFIDGHGQLLGKRDFYKIMIRNENGSETHTEGIIKA